MNELTENEIFERVYNTGDSRVDLHRAGTNRRNVYRNGGSQRINRNNVDITSGLSDKFKQHFNKQCKVINVRVKGNDAKLQKRDNNTVSTIHVSFQLTLWGYIFNTDDIKEIFNDYLMSKSQEEFGQKLFGYVKKIIESSNGEIYKVDLSDIDEYKPLQQYRYRNIPYSMYVEGNVFCMKV